MGPRARGQLHPNQNAMSHDAPSGDPPEELLPGVEQP